MRNIDERHSAMNRPSNLLCLITTSLGHSHPRCTICSVCINSRYGMNRSIRSISTDITDCVRKDYFTIDNNVGSQSVIELSEKPKSYPGSGYDNEDACVHEARL